MENQSSLVRQNKRVDDGTIKSTFLFTTFTSFSFKLSNVRYQDAVAVALHNGNADLFVTVTGRENIAEIRRLQQGRTLSNLVELTNRFFQVKLQAILDDIIVKQVYGRTVGRVYVIEYQKRYHQIKF